MVKKTQYNNRSRLSSAYFQKHVRHASGNFYRWCYCAMKKQDGAKGYWNLRASKMQSNCFTPSSVESLGLVRLGDRKGQAQRRTSKRITQLGIDSSNRLSVFRQSSRLKMVPLPRRGSCHLPQDAMDGVFVSLVVR